MNANAQKWVETLETTTIPQLEGWLGRADGARCCLGVACDLAVEAGVIPEPTTQDTFLMYGVDYGILPNRVREWLGLKTRKGVIRRGESSLVGLNDQGTPFAQIAAAIHENEADLFLPQ